MKIFGPDKKISGNVKNLRTPKFQKKDEEEYFLSPSFGLNI